MVVQRVVDPLTHAPPRQRLVLHLRFQRHLTVHQDQSSCQPFRIVGRGAVEQPRQVVDVVEVQQAAQQHTAPLPEDQLRHLAPIDFGNPLHRAHGLDHLCRALLVVHTQHLHHQVLRQVGEGRLSHVVQQGRRLQRLILRAGHARQVVDAQGVLPAGGVRERGPELGRQAGEGNPPQALELRRLHQPGCPVGEANGAVERVLDFKSDHRQTSTQCLRRRHQLLALA